MNWPNIVFFVGILVLGWWTSEYDVLTHREKWGVWIVFIVVCVFWMSSEPRAHGHAQPDYPCETAPGPMGC